MFRGFIANIGAMMSYCVSAAGDLVGHLLLEDVSDLLLEDGSLILLEHAGD